MKPYANRSHDAGVAAYDYTRDSIRLRFARDRRVYTYHAHTIGRSNLATMKRLADAGDGLTTFINTHPKIRDGYTRNT